MKGKDMQEKISFLGKFHFTWKKVLFSLVLLYIAALVIPYIPHKKVKEDFKHSFKAMNFTVRSPEQNELLT